MRVPICDLASRFPSPTLFVTIKEAHQWEEKMRLSQDHSDDQWQSQAWTQEVCHETSCLLTHCGCPSEGLSVTSFGNGLCLMAQRAWQNEHWSRSGFCMRMLGAVWMTASQRAWQRCSGNTAFEVLLYFPNSPRFWFYHQTISFKFFFFNLPCSPV